VIASTSQGLDSLSPGDVVRRFHHRLWGDGDVTALDDTVAPDALTTMTGFEGSTIDVMREDVDRYFGAFTDVSTEIVELLADGRTVALWWRTTGTQTGPYGDIAPMPTGLRITMEGVDFLTVVDGKITAVRSHWDAAGVYRQFDLLAENL
jgi:predicted ester cyclase